MHQNQSKNYDIGWRINKKKIVKVNNALARDEDSTREGDGK